MPGLKTVAYSGDDYSWLGSALGVENQMTRVLDPTKFNAQVKNGVVPSGQAVAEVKGELEPYNASGSGGVEKLLGFIYNSVAVSGGKTAVAVLTHGRVYVDRLPGEFTAPTPDKNPTGIVFVTKGEGA